jgi:hypothetical protein
MKAPWERYEPEGIDAARCDTCPHCSKTGANEKLAEVAICCDQIRERFRTWEETKPPWGFSWHGQFEEIADLVDSLLGEDPSTHTLRKEFNDLLRSVQGAKNSYYWIQRMYRAERRLHTRKAALTEPLLRRAARWKRAALKWWRKVNGGDVR